MGGGNRYADEPQSKQVFYQIEEWELLQERMKYAMAEVCMNNLISLRAPRQSLQRALGIDLGHARQRSASWRSRYYFCGMVAQVGGRHAARPWTRWLALMSVGANSLLGFMTE